MAWIRSLNQSKYSSHSFQHAFPRDVQPAMDVKTMFGGVKFAQAVKSLFFLPLCSHYEERFLLVHNYIEQWCRGLVKDASGCHGNDYDGFADRQGR